MTIRKLISYRQVWMALAIISIILFHSELGRDILGIKWMTIFGYGGVDFFFFSSGIGCYYSYMSDENCLEFIKRRIIRIMPTYLIFITVWCSYRFFIGEMTRHACVGNLLCIQYFINKEYSFNWFISAIWIFYIITPFIAKYISEIECLKQYIFLFVFLFVISIVFWNVHDYIIIFSRLPIYCLGCVVAKNDRKMIKRKEVLLFSILAIVGIVILGFSYTFFYEKLWDFGLWWYPFFFIVPGFCICISLICEHFSQKNIGKKFVNIFNSMGKYTFELYLIHIMVIEILDKFLLESHLFDNWWVEVCFLFLVLAAGCWILHTMTQYFMKAFARKK